MRPIQIFPWALSLISFHLVAGSFTFTTIDFPDALTTLPSGINDRGEVVGVYSIGSGGFTESFLLSGGTFSTQGFPGALTTQNSGINSSGLEGDFTISSVEQLTAFC